MTRVLYQYTAFKVFYKYPKISQIHLSAALRNFNILGSIKQNLQRRKFTFLVKQTDTSTLHIFNILFNPVRNNNEMQCIVT